MISLERKVSMTYTKRKKERNGKNHHIIKHIKISIPLLGKLVVNIWGGLADAEKMTPWKKHTLSVFWSTTKGVSAIVVAHLVDR